MNANIKLTNPTNVVPDTPTFLISLDMNESREVKRDFDGPEGMISYKPAGPFKQTGDLDIAFGAIDPITLRFPIEADRGMEHLEIPREFFIDRIGWIVLNRPPMSDRTFRHLLHYLAHAPPLLPEILKFVIIEDDNNPQP